MDDWTRKVVTEFLELSGEAQSRIDPELFHRLANLGVILGGERVAEIRGLPSASDAFQAGRDSGDAFVEPPHPPYPNADHVDADKPEQAAGVEALARELYAAAWAVDLDDHRWNAIDMTRYRSQARFVLAREQMLTRRSAQKEFRDG